MKANRIRPSPALLLWLLVTCCSVPAWGQASDGLRSPRPDSVRVTSSSSTAALEPIKDVVSREVGALHDSPVTAGDAASREVGVLVDAPVASASDAMTRELGVLVDAPFMPAPEAISRELAVLVDAPASPAGDAVAREVGVLVDSPTTVASDAASREVSVSVNPSLVLVTDVASREVGVLVDAPIGAVAEATGRELSVYVDPPVAVQDAASREVSILVDAGVTAPADALAREVAVLTDPPPEPLGNLASREVGVLVDQVVAILDAASREVSVLTGLATPTQLAMMEVRAVPEGIEVKWQLGPELSGASATLERAQSADGAFARVAASVSDLEGAMMALDRDVLEGRTYWYRIVVRTGDPEDLVFGPMSATADVGHSILALAPITPNPASGKVRVAFAIPEDMRVRISVIDVLGREVAVFLDEQRRAGRYSGTWGLDSRNGRVGAGVYFVRLQAEKSVITRKVVVRN